MKLSFNRYEVLQILFSGIDPYQELRLDFNGHELKIHASWGDYVVSAYGKGNGRLIIENYELRKLLQSVDTQIIELTCSNSITVRGIKE